MGTKKNTSKSSTEEKIKDAAQTVFLKKGYSATRTRDIAAASDVNLALINYYFKSKENLYRIIMLETMGAFLNSMLPVLNNEKSSLKEKIELMINNYIDLFSQRPEIPLFVLNELNNNPDHFIEKTGIREIMMQSVFFNQLLAKLDQNKMNVSPFHMFMNMMSMTIFPFVASPLIKGLHTMNDIELAAFMEERKKMIPIWMNKILEL